MKKFLIKLLVISLPILLMFLGMEILLRQIPNDYSFKYSFLKNNASKIETLILGSSHSYYGLNPEYITSFSFNASHISQSIDYDYAIFEKFNDQLSGLKTILIPIDYFTFYSRTSVGVENWRVKNYEIYYGINKSCLPKDHSELLSFKFNVNLKRAFNFITSRNKTSITCSDLGYGNIFRDQKDLQKTGILAAKRHTYTDETLFSENVTIIKKFIAYTKENDIKILFYTSPAYKTYTDNLKLYQLSKTINTIKGLIEENEHCSYLNFLTDKDFQSMDFRDADHLNKNGAIKFSKKINSILKN
jgi:hypothetical protein